MRGQGAGVAISFHPRRAGPHETFGIDRIEVGGNTEAIAIAALDKIEHHRPASRRHHRRQLFQVAGAARDRRLKALVIEVSYTSERPDNLLFGHLTPRYVLEGLRELDRLAGGGALKGVPVVISHIKYSLTREQPQARVLQELRFLPIKFERVYHYYRNLHLRIQECSDGKVASLAALMAEIAAIDRSLEGMQHACDYGAPCAADCAVGQTLKARGKKMAEALKLQAAGG